MEAEVHKSTCWTKSLSINRPNYDLSTLINFTLEDELIRVKSVSVEISVVSLNFSVSFLLFNL